MPKGELLLALCQADNLINHAGDVTLKEGRPLVVVVHETRKGKDSGA